MPASLRSVAASAAVVQQLFAAVDRVQCPMHQRLSADRAMQHCVIRIAAVARLDLPHPCHRRLREQTPVDNGRMGIVDVVKRYFALVLDLLVGQVALDAVFLQDHIPGVLFIMEHVLKLQQLPLAPGRRRHVPGNHVLHDLAGCFAVGVAHEDLPDNGGFLRDDDVHLLLGMPVAVDGDAWLPAFLELLAHAPFHIFADGAALFLREGSHHRQEHLGDGFGSINAFLLEKELHAHALQLPHIVQTVHGVPGKAADALGDDVINFSRSAILNHLLKAHVMTGAGAADSLVSQCQARTNRNL